MCCTDLGQLGRWQALVLCEKLAEIGDETFHLLGHNLKAVCSSQLYTFISDLHNSCHNIEHTLHSFCFFADVSLIYRGKFFAKKNSNLTDWGKTAGKICHLAAHFLATMELFSKLQILHVPIIAYLYVWTPHIAVIGSLFITIPLFFEPRLNQKALIMSGSELIFNLSPIGNIKSIAGIINGCSVVNEILHAFDNKGHAH
jgi:hypothetical protein